MFAGAMSGMAYVRNSEKPSVDYSAMNDAELDAARVDPSPTPAAVAKKARPKAPAVNQPDPTPTVSPREVRPKMARSDAASADPSESAKSTEPSDSPAGPLAGLGALFNGGARR